MKVNTLADLKQIRETNKNEMSLRKKGEGPKVIVGMATCGIEAGAREVLNAFVSEVERLGRTDVMVGLMGCAGLCSYEPIVEVRVPGQPKVTYVKMTPEKAAKVMEEHLGKGNVCKEFTAEAAAE